MFNIQTGVLTGDNGVEGEVKVHESILTYCMCLGTPGGAGLNGDGDGMEMR